jgi:hypothetical protein
MSQPPRTAELLAKGYERWFDPLHAYVSRHVTGRQVQVRIVREVLSENLDLLVGRRDEASEIRRLKATANRLIAEVLTGEDAAPTSRPRPGRATKDGLEKLHER